MRKRWAAYNTGGTGEVSINREVISAQTEHKQKIDRDSLCTILIARVIGYFRLMPKGEMQRCRIG